jgi:hypothetical protein
MPAAVTIVPLDVSDAMLASTDTHDLFLATSRANRAARKARMAKTVSGAGVLFARTPTGAADSRVNAASALSGMRPGQSTASNWKSRVAARKKYQVAVDPQDQNR